MLQVGSQKYIWKFNFSFLFSYIVYSQIWLNHLMDDHHLEQLHLKIEIKKRKEKKKKVIPIAIQVPTSLLRSLVGIWDIRTVPTRRLG